jgi:hypothetical protein
MRGKGSIERGLLSEAGRLLSKHVLPGHPYSKKHMDNDTLIIGFNFEP